jgi:HTH-type transcriptional regulator/antitoxin HigA
MSFKPSMSGSSSPKKSTAGTAGKKAVNEARYAELLAKVRPRAPRTVKENERLLKVARRLIDKGVDRTPEETELGRLLTTLIARFEEEHYDSTRAEPHEVLEYLMEEHGLRQRDLLGIFGTRSRVSEALAGKRGITREQAAALSERFKLPAKAFMKA